VLSSVMAAACSVAFSNALSKLLVYSSSEWWSAVDKADEMFGGTCGGLLDARLLLSKKFAGTFEPAGACLTFGIELFLAFVDSDKMGFCGIPSFVGGWLDLPRLHLLMVENFGAIHALLVVLDLRGVGGRDTNVSAKLLLLVELAGKLRDVAREVPLDVKGLGGLLF